MGRRKASDRSLKFHVDFLAHYLAVKFGSDQLCCILNVTLYRPPIDSMHTWL